MIKNEPGTWRVLAWNTATDSPALGEELTITGKIAIDGGAATPLTDTNPDETEDGYYVFALSADETNGDQLDIYPESSTPNIEVIGTPASQTTVERYGTTVSPTTPLGEDEVMELARTPKRVRTAEGTVEERSVGEMIEADRYGNSKDAADAVPWGLRIARAVNRGGPPG